MPSPRVLKLADQIKVIVGEMLQRRIKDPRLGFITVTDCRLTGDSRDATIFYTVLGDDAEQAGTAAALKSATGIIRQQIGKQLGLRFTPTLVFIADNVPEVARQLEGLLDDARSGDAEVAARRVGAVYAGESDPYKKPHVDEDPNETEDDVDAPGSDAAGPDEPGAGRQDPTGESLER